jgi:hypothetical protein
MLLAQDVSRPAGRRAARRLIAKGDPNEPVPPEPAAAPACGRLFLTEGGLETSLIYDDGLELPRLRVLRPAEGTPRVPSACAATTCASPRWPRERGLGAVFERRPGANADWGARLGYDAAALADVNAARGRPCWSACGRRCAAARTCLSS